MSQAVGKENIAKLEAFFETREKEGDWEDYLLTAYALNVAQVALDAGLASAKTITVPKGISTIYRAKMTTLIERGILEADTRSSKDKVTSKTLSKIDAQQIKRANKTAETNAALEEELYAERKKYEKLEAKLQRLEKIEAYMDQTGRC